MSEPAPHPEEAFSFAVLSLFACDPQHCQELLTLMRDFVASQVRWQPGLHSVELFSDETGGHLLTLARWRDRDAFQAFKQSESGQHVTSFGLTLRPQVFFLRPEAAVTREPALEERLGASRR